ncbi:nectin-1 isoform X2 [Bombina bombina]|uniref:nectin-1 isoform X2 n=1 Tax=Bombina bombina TaxID=8345 RepID=UPI00235B24C5|nr:nectin-1 isoform X2 [Bombina bombina]
MKRKKKQIPAPVLMVIVFAFTLGAAQVIMHVKETVYADQGSTATLYCKIETNESLTQLTWQRKNLPDNENILTYQYGKKPDYISPLAQRVTILGSEAADGSISINNVTLDEDGTFICVYTTFPSGVKEKEIHLIIRVLAVVTLKLPLVVSQSNPVSVAVCEASVAKPAAVIQWTAEGMEFTSRITETKHYNKTVTTQSQLWVVPSPDIYGKNISCTVSQSNMEPDQMENASLTNIQYPPQDVDIKVHFSRDEKLQLECQADSIPPPTYTWKRKWENNSISYYRLLGTSTNLDLLMKDVNGVYICDATNIIGKYSHSFYIYKGSNPSCHVGLLVSLIIIIILAIAVTAFVYVRNKQRLTGFLVPDSSYCSCSLCFLTRLG